jgi:hypothetical protein
MCCRTSNLEIQCMQQHACCMVRRYYAGACAQSWAASPT